MSSRLRTALWILCTLLLLALLLPPGRALSQEIQAVLVTNFPELQKVEGTVQVEGIVRHGTAKRFREIAVSPAKPTDTRRLTPGGILETDGYTSMILGLAGEFQTMVPRPGTVGAILLPDEEPIVRVFQEEGQMEFPQEIQASAASAKSGYFSSEPGKFTIGFPRYRIFFYNTTDRPVEVKLYVYLTN
jgi:hypothetical protein